MDGFLRDVRFGTRLLFERPGVSLLAILALTLGIGLTTTAFSIVNGLVFKELPFADSDRIVYAKRGDGKAVSAAYEQIIAIREESSSFAAVAGYLVGTINMTVNRTPRRYNGAFVTDGFLAVLRAAPLHGRFIEARDIGPSGEGVIVISHEVWTRDFRSDPDILGRTVRANGFAATIVGVMPAGFTFPSYQDVWVAADFADATDGDEEKSRHLLCLARLKDDATRDEAGKELGAVVGRLDLPMMGGGDGSDVYLSGSGGYRLDATGRIWVMSMVASAVFVLLISCANVANLLLARSTQRGKELAIRSALGATRFRIILQLLSESIVLAALGAAGGLIYTLWAVDWIWASINTGEANLLPAWMRFTVDARVFLFIAATTILTGLVAGILPAVQASRTNVNEMLKEGAKTQTGLRMGRFSRGLVVGQIALSCALLIGAGLTLRTLINVASIDPGYEPERVLTMRMGLFDADYPTADDRLAFYHNVIDEVEALPQVEAAGISTWISLYGSYLNKFAPVERRDLESQASFMAYTDVVSDDWFTTIDAHLVEGQGFGALDPDRRARAAIINESVARKTWPGEEAVGQQLFSLGGDRTEPLEVVGVVRDVKLNGFSEADTPRAALYLPFVNGGSDPGVVPRFVTLMVRGHEGHAARDLFPTVNDAILTLDPHLPVYFVETLDAFIARETRLFRLTAVLFSGFGIIAVFLAALGIYGVMTFSVNNRRREIGIRIALGARTGNIVNLVLRQGLWQLAFGLALGLGLAYGMARAVAVFLYGVAPYDALTFLSVVLLLLAISLASCLLPLVRALRLSPMQALRQE